MTRYHPRSPGARLSALRRAVAREDMALECLLSAFEALGAGRIERDRVNAPLATLTAMTEARMEAERELWEAMAGHGLD